MSYKLALSHLGYSLQKVNELLDKIKTFFISGSEKFNDYKTHLLQIVQNLKNEDMGPDYKKDLINKIDEALKNLDDMRDISVEILDKSKDTKKELKLGRKDINELLMQIEDENRKRNFSIILEKINDIYDELSKLIATAKKELHSAIIPEISSLRKMRRKVDKAQALAIYMRADEIIDDDRKSKKELERIHRLFNRVLGKFRKQVKEEKEKFKEISEFEKDIKDIGKIISIEHLKKERSEFSKVG